MAEPDVFHRALTALGAPAQAGETLLDALRLGHDMEATRKIREGVPCWGCRRCWAAVTYSYVDGHAGGSATAKDCAEVIRGYAASVIGATRWQLAWLAEHDRTKAGRG